jgi:hypothetical protein
MTDTQQTANKRTVLSVGGAPLKIMTTDSLTCNVWSLCSLLQEMVLCEDLEKKGKTMLNF